MRSAIWLKLIAVVLVYHALVEGLLRTPYGTLFHELTTLNRNLDAELQRRKNSETHLRAANHEIAMLYRAARLLHTTLRLDALSHLILSMAVSAEGGGFRRAMLFTANPRGGVLQGMLGVDRESAALVLPPVAAPGPWDEPRLDAAVFAAQRESACNQAVVKQRLALAAADNTLARACLERRMILVETPEAESPGGRRLAEALSLGTYVCVPLCGRDEPFGVLLVDFADNGPDPPCGAVALSRAVCPASDRGPGKCPVAASARGRAPRTAGGAGATDAGGEAVGAGRNGRATCP